LYDTRVLTNDSLEVYQKEQFYKFGVKLAKVALPMLLIPQIMSLINSLYTISNEEVVAGEFFGSSVLYKFLCLSRFIGGIIALVASGKSIYSHGSLHRVELANTKLALPIGKNIAFLV